MKKLKIITVILLVLLLGVFFMIRPYEPTQIALDAMKSSSTIEVLDKDYIAFIPQNPSDTGLILYPGAKVKPASYAPLMHHLAAASYSSFIAKMPLNFAILSPNKADQIIRDHPEIKHWYMMGHSLGGVMAAQYTYENTIDGLILLASYPQEKYDLSQKPIKVISLIGSLDGLIDLSKINEKKPFLPDTTEYLIIEGGNHAQMGYYGAQNKDHKATITTSEQEAIIYDAILKLIKTL